MIRLPILPMLAVSSPPFDHEAYSFEVKWDGIRALAARTSEGWRLWGRGGTDYTGRYAELEALSAWPVGTVVDGELVAWRQGRADLPYLLRRHFLSQPRQVARAASWCPVHYVVFDLLTDGGQSLLSEPLWRRRELLAELCQRVAVPGVIWSAGVVGSGRAFYEAVVAQGHEGVVAKLLRAAYRPGTRSPAWRKIKPGPVRSGRAGSKPTN